MAVREHVRLMTDHLCAKARGGDGMSILNVGFGLGIVDRLFQATSPLHHVIIEAHPQVLAYMRSKGVYEWPGVKVLEGRWQDFVGERMGELMEASGGMGFDAIFVDTFAEGYEGKSDERSEQARRGERARMKEGRMEEWRT